MRSRPQDRSRATIRARWCSSQQRLQRWLCGCHCTLQHFVGQTKRMHQTEIIRDLFFHYGVCHTLRNQIRKLLAGISWTLSRSSPCFFASARTVSISLNPHSLFLDLKLASNYIESNEGWMTMITQCYSISHVKCHYYHSYYLLIALACKLSISIECSIDSKPRRRLQHSR
jgi:hypothetical protein